MKTKKSCYMGKNDKGTHITICNCKYGDKSHIG